MTKAPTRGKRGLPKALEQEDDERPADDQSLEGFIKDLHGDLDQPQDGMPNMGWLKDQFQTKSAIIRWLTFRGYSVSQIAKHTGWRYQMVRNIVNNPMKRGPNEDWRKPELLPNGPLSDPKRFKPEDN